MQAFKLIVFWISIIAIVLFGGLYLIDKRDHNNQDKYEVMQARIDSLLVVNDSLQSKFSRIDSTNVELNYKLQERRERIVYIKQKTNEKITSITSYSDSELVNFFANIKTNN